MEGNNGALPKEGFHTGAFMFVLSTKRKRLCPDLNDNVWDCPANSDQLIRPFNQIFEPNVKPLTDTILQLQSRLVFFKGCISATCM